MKKSVGIFFVSVMPLVSFILHAQEHYSQTLTNMMHNSAINALSDKIILGRTEQVYFDDIKQLEHVPFAGKIDTGADTTSMHATNIHITSTHPKLRQLTDQALLEKIIKVDTIDRVSRSNWTGGLFKPYQVSVNFVITHPYNGEKIQITRPLERVSVIRNRTDTKPILRPTITLPLSIADKTVTTEVNLTDRAHFSTPILIGKTFLKHNAWVLAGYDYLQTESSAIVLGKKEQVQIEGLSQKVSYSIQHRYSALNARNIDIDASSQRVSFTINDSKKNTRQLTLPLIRMLNVGGKPRPLVYVPVSLGHNRTQHWLVYLTDRSELNSQIRLGKNTLNRHFMIDLGTRNLLKKEIKTAENFPNAIQVSSNELLKLDNILIPASPSLTVQTSVLVVSDYKITKKNDKDWVRYTLKNSEGQKQEFFKPIVKKLVVGSEIRPVVLGNFAIHGQEKEQAYALKRSEKPSDDHIIIGSKLYDHVLVNNRSEHLLNPYPIIKAGNVEVVQALGRSFPAKLDTGADVSSISAYDIKPFKKDGRSMVSFTYSNDLGVKERITAKVVDTIKITEKNRQDATVRPIIEMTVKVGTLEKKVQVNLQDRRRFKYSMILGRNFLKHGVLVSSDEEYLLTEAL
ncbi:RimK/LysX family protein [Vibrio caribbeanicus]|uniref:putative ATP-dependent zinc protease n=1 Tax=Vibrio caribbeanicus TaxID=701175 RepID=UPI0022836A7D|nr:RimK/LysX family protein [Vibrio caribbeanicus]MCY9844307.1 RimK/LysX family protein [Vibrio caribbeanicus]